MIKSVFYHWKWTPCRFNRPEANTLVLTKSLSMQQSSSSLFGFNNLQAARPGQCFGLLVVVQRLNWWIKKRLRINSVLWGKVISVSHCWRKHIKRLDRGVREKWRPMGQRNSRVLGHVRKQRWVQQRWIVCWWVRRQHRWSKMLLPSVCSILLLLILLLILWSISLTAQWLLFHATLLWWWA